MSRKKWSNCWWICELRSSIVVTVGRQSVEGLVSTEGWIQNWPGSVNVLHLPRLPLKNWWCAMEFLHFKLESRHHITLGILMFCIPTITFLDLRMTSMSRHGFWSVAPDRFALPHCGMSPGSRTHQDGWSHLDWKGAQTVMPTVIFLAKQLGGLETIPLWSILILGDGIENCVLQLEKSPIQHGAMFGWFGWNVWFFRLAEQIVQILAWSRSFETSAD